MLIVMGAANTGPLEEVGRSAARSRNGNGSDFVSFDAGSNGNGVEFASFDAGLTFSFAMELNRLLSKSGSMLS